MPKVLHVIARINRGGTARYLENLIPGLQDLGWETLIATGKVQQGEEEDSIVSELPVIKIQHLGRKISLLNDFKARNEIRALIKNFKPDIIQTHTFKAGLLVRTIRTKVPIIHTFHGHLLADPSFKKKTVKLIIQVEKFLAKNSAHLLTTGEHVVQDLLKCGIGKKNQYSSVFPKIKTIEKISKNQIANHFNVPLNRPIIGWVGRLEPVKNPQLMIRVASMMDDCFFVVFGTGNLLAGLQAQAPLNVKFLGWQERTEIWSLIDIYISTSFNEGISNSILEAKAVNLPIVASRIPGNLESLSDYDLAFFADLNYNSFTLKIQEALSVSRRIKINNQSNHSFHTTVNNIYRRVLNSSDY